MKLVKERFSLKLVVESSIGPLKIMIFGKQGYYKYLTNLDTFHGLNFVWQYLQMWFIEQNEELMRDNYKICA